MYRFSVMYGATISSVHEAYQQCPYVVGLIPLRIFKFHMTDVSLMPH